MKLTEKINNLLEAGESVSEIQKNIIKKVGYDKFGGTTYRSGIVKDSKKEIARIVQAIKSMGELEIYDDHGIINIYAGSLGARSVAEITGLKKKDGIFVSIDIQNKNFRNRSGKQL